MNVQLTWPELFLAATVGITRQISALKERRPDAHGYAGDPWSDHIQGAACELAVARVVGRYWNALATNLKDVPGDIGSFHEVRSTTLDNGRLLLHESDRDDAVWVLAIPRLTARTATLQPVVSLRGWLYGYEAKRPQYWTELQKGRPCFAVPQSDLHDMMEIPR